MEDAALKLEPSHSYVVRTDNPDGAVQVQRAFLGWLRGQCLRRQYQKDRGVAYLTRNPVAALDILDSENPLAGVDLYHIAGSTDPKSYETLVKDGALKPRKVAAFSVLNPTPIVQELSEPPRHMLVGPGVVELMRSSVGMSQTVRVLGSLSDQAAMNKDVMYVVFNPKAFQTHEAEMLVTAPQLEPMQI